MYCNEKYFEILLNKKKQMNLLRIREREREKERERVRVRVCVRCIADALPLRNESAADHIG